MLCYLNLDVFYIAKLRSIYYATFESNLRYSSLVWAQKIISFKGKSRQIDVLFKAGIQIHVVYSEISKF